MHLRVPGEQPNPTMQPPWVGEEWVGGVSAGLWFSHLLPKLCSVLLTHQVPHGQTHRGVSEQAMGDSCHLFGLS